MHERQGTDGWAPSRADIGLLARELWSVVRHYELSEDVDIHLYISVDETLVMRLERVNRATRERESVACALDPIQVKAAEGWMLS